MKLLTKKQKEYIQSIYGTFFSYEIDVPSGEFQCENCGAIYKEDLEVCERCGM